MTLKPAKTITPQDWMISKESQILFDALEKGETTPIALFVGGCVRNALLDMEVEDIDLATSLKPESVVKKLEAEDITVIPTGLQHGTVTAVINKKPFEITTLRHDVETDGRHAVVEFTDNWKEDAKRRDFTMNTLLADRKGNIYDPLGQGIKDLESHTIKFVGKAEERVQEDYLRLLRFFRFHAIYGTGDFDKTALKACRKYADKLSTLSKERITQEYLKIMAAEKPWDILAIMFENKVLPDLNFDTYDPKFFQYFCEFQSRYGLVSIPSRLYVQGGLDIANVKRMENLMIFPKVFMRDMQAISDALTQPDLSCDHDVKVSIYRYGRVITAQALMIELVQDRVMNGYAPKALSIIQQWEVPTFPVSGNDLMENGIPQGPALGDTLEKLENWWIENGFSATREECLKELKKF